MHMHGKGLALEELGRIIEVEARIVPADVEYLEPLEVQMAVQGLDEHISGSEEGVEGLDRRVIVV